MRILVILEELDYDNGNALEMALQYKERSIVPREIEIIVLSAGGEEAEKTLEECLALGADEVYLISDPVFLLYDEFTAANLLAEAIKKIGEYDLILTGFISKKKSPGILGPMIAELLDLPQISFVKNFKIENKWIQAASSEETMDTIITAPLPCLLIISLRTSQIRGMTIKGIQKSLKKSMIILPLEEQTHDRNKKNIRTEVPFVFQPINNKKQLMLIHTDEDTKMKDRYNSLVKILKTALHV